VHELEHSETKVGCARQSHCSQNCCQQGPDVSHRPQHNSRRPRPGTWAGRSGSTSRHLRTAL